MYSEESHTSRTFLDWGGSRTGTNSALFLRLRRLTRFFAVGAPLSVFVTVAFLVATMAACNQKKTPVPVARMMSVSAEDVTLAVGVPRFDWIGPDDSAEQENNAIIISRVLDEDLDSLSILMDSVVVASWPVYPGFSKDPPRFVSEFVTWGTRQDLGFYLLIDDASLREGRHVFHVKAMDSSQNSMTMTATIFLKRTADLVRQETVFVSQGWNMIGTSGREFPTRNIFSDPPGIVASGVYEYSTSYTTTDSLKFGRGYWIKTISEGKLIFGAFPVTPMLPFRSQRAPNPPLE